MGQFKYRMLSAVILVSTDSHDFFLVQGYHVMPYFLCVLQQILTEKIPSSPNNVPDLGRRYLDFVAQEVRLGRVAATAAPHRFIDISVSGYCTATPSCLLRPAGS